MSGNHDELEALGRRAGELLRDSATALDGHTRSRLAQARAAALQGRRRPRWLSLRHLAPAGAVASVLLVTLLLVGRDAGDTGVNGATTTALYDLELLTDGVAFELSQEADLEFIEWAAGMAELEGAGG